MFATNVALLADMGKPRPYESTVGKLRLCRDSEYSSFRIF